MDADGVPLLPFLPYPLPLGTKNLIRYATLLQAFLIRFGSINIAAFERHLGKSKVG
jgi:hypothetical protein